MNYLINYIDYLIVNISTYPATIQFALFFTFLNLIIGISFYISIIVVRRIKDYRENIILKLQSKQSKFFKIILDDEKVYQAIEIIDLFEENFGKIEKKSYISLIPALEEIVNQDRKYVKFDNYNTIINALNVVQHLEKKLAFSDKRTRLRIFQILSNLDLTISDSIILPHTYSKNSHLRKESRISYLAVSKNDPFKFFEQVGDNVLNDWDQICLMQQFSIHHKDNLPDFGKWIKYSKEPSQTAFFIKMAAHFQQHSSIEVLLDQLHNPNHKIRIETIYALAKLGVKTVEDELIKMYYYQPLSCQNAIVEAISILETGKALDFLIQAYNKSTNLDSKTILAESIYLYNIRGKNYILELIDKQIGFNKLILQHVTNPLIISKLKKLKTSFSTLISQTSDGNNINEIRAIIGY